MNRTIYLLLCISILSSSALAQNSTYYYKFVRSEKLSKISGGQFITFTSDACYDSDIEGYSVENGVLKFESFDGSIHTYRGKSYWGNAIYRFNKDKSILNIVVADNTYVYKRGDASPGVKTSSHIKSKTSSSTQPYIYTPNYPASPSTNPGIQNNSSTHNTHQQNKSGQNVGSNRKCNWCNGTGQIVREDNAPPNFGIEKPKKKCNVCGIWYNPNLFTHYHIHCSHCGGSGNAR